MEKKSTTNALLILMGVLIIVAIVARIATFEVTKVSAVTQLISLVFVVLYGFWLYKKPHGNMLKYAMLIFAFSTIAGSCYYLLAYQVRYHILKIIASAAVCYCAGRLNRIEQNKIIMPIIGLAYLVVSICAMRLCSTLYSSVFSYLPACLNFTINYLVLMIAYFVRFEEHKEAGLMDMPKA